MAAERGRRVRHDCFRRRLVRELLPGAELLRLARQRGDLARRPQRRSGSGHLPGRTDPRRTRGLRQCPEGGVMPTQIDRERVRQLLEDEAQLVEVLPRDEYEDEHLPGAINIPLKELDGERTQRLERSRPVIVYCYDSQ